MQGFEKTGLGERVANLFVKIFGKSTLGLAYGLSIAEVGAFVPACLCLFAVVPWPTTLIVLPFNTHTHTRARSWVPVSPQALVAPAMPSSTARAGGIFMPIIASLAHGAGSEPSELHA